MYKKTYSATFISDKIALLYRAVPYIVMQYLDPLKCRSIVIDHFSEMSQYAYDYLKSSIRRNYDPFHLPTKNDITTLVKELETEFACNSGLTALGIEDDYTIERFVSNQWTWLMQNFTFEKGGPTLSELYEIDSKETFADYCSSKE